jgi:hypothetical protein
MLRVALAILSCQAILAAKACAEENGVRSFTFKGTSPATCAFSSRPRMASAQNMALGSATAGVATLTITELIDSTTARLKPAAIALTLAAVCNVPHHITLSSQRGALVASSQALSSQGTFLTELRYRATAQWGHQTVAFIASGSSVTHSEAQVVGGAQAGDVSVEIRIDGSDNDISLPVLAGTYEDTLIISANARF